ncbi:MAG: hypothetical protein AB1925_08595 [Actinomycetota bacterium]
MNIPNTVAVSLVAAAAVAGVGLAVSPMANAADYGVSIATYCAANVPSGTGAASR